MGLSIKTYSQDSFDIFGNSVHQVSSEFRLNSFEGNPLNLNEVKSWEFSAVFGAELTSGFNGNVYLFSVGKRLGSNYFYARYTPGFQQKFTYKIGSIIPTDNSSSVETELKRTIKYSEKFGFGYSINISDMITAGFNFRLFEQSLTEDNPVFVSDTNLSSISIESSELKEDRWRGDIGVAGSLSDNFLMSVSSINLFNFGSSNEGINEYRMRTEKGAAFRLNYQPLKELNFGLTYETTKSLILSTGLSFRIFGGTAGFGLSALHDNRQQPYICGIFPSLNYFSGAISITISGIKYLSDRTKPAYISHFLEDGISSINNNQFSFDRIFTSLNFALSFEPEQRVKFAGLDIVNDIFPTLSDEYVLNPIAFGYAVNISDEKVSVKPSSFIEQVNNKPVFSPAVTILPGDTAEIPFYTLIDVEKEVYTREIAQAEFSLTTTNNEPDDEIRRPILVNNRNNWDGNVNTLRYFVHKNFDFSNRIAKRILSQKKDEMTYQNSILADFEKAKVLFNYFVQGMNYVADPRASTEYVQFPNETLNLKGGDCDDLSVAFSSILESIGIQTAFVDYKSPDGISHVNLLVNLSIPPGDLNLITKNDKKIFIRKDSRGREIIWIPIETTSLTDFPTAWSAGAEKFQAEAIGDYGLSTGKVVIIDIF